MSDTAWVPYNFAFLRVVPHVHLETFVNVGVVLHARTAEFLGMRVISEVEELRRRVADVDHELLARYLRDCQAVCEGDPAAGPVALTSASERFHWLTAPRSDVIQPSPTHAGLSLDPGAELEVLFHECVLGRSGSPPGEGQDG
jgi:hypothetical protein